MGNVIAFPRHVDESDPAAAAAREEMRHILERAVAQLPPAFRSVLPMPGTDADEVLRLAASLDQGSEHPLADAIVSAAREQGLALAKPVDFESGSGIGVRGTVEGRRLALGTDVASCCRITRSGRNSSRCIRRISRSRSTSAWL